MDAVVDSENMLIQQHENYSAKSPPSWQAWGKLHKLLPILLSASMNTVDSNAINFLSFSTLVAQVHRRASAPKHPGLDYSTVSIAKVSGIEVMCTTSFSFGFMMVHAKP